MKLLNKLERRFGRYAIENLMMVICIGQLLTYLATIFTNGMIYQNLILLWPSVMRGEVWRLVSFLFLPGSLDLISFLLSLYFYYMIGTALENEWGSFNFNCFYLLGALGVIAATAITGFIGTAYYINMSMFFAFALLYPDYQVLLFYFIPVRVKWIALFDALYFVYCFVKMPLDRPFILLSLVNLLIFFGADGVNTLRRTIHRYKMRRQFKNNWR